MRQPTRRGTARRWLAPAVLCIQSHLPDVHRQSHSALVVRSRVNAHPSEAGRYIRLLSPESRAMCILKLASVVEENNVRDLGTRSTLPERIDKPEPIGRIANATLHINILSASRSKTFQCQSLGRGNDIRRGTARTSSNQRGWSCSKSDRTISAALRSRSCCNATECSTPPGNDCPSIRVSATHTSADVLRGPHMLEVAQAARGNRGRLRRAWRTFPARLRA